MHERMNNPHLCANEGAKTHKQTEISEGCNKDVNLAGTEPNGLLLAAGLWHQKMRKYFQVIL
jgi:hypothetical protein